MNSHQAVSKLAGKSWKLETLEIKQKYQRLATIEKDNHTKAHPGYRLSLKFKGKKTHHEKQILNLDPLSNSCLDPTSCENNNTVSVGLGELGKPAMCYLNPAWLVWDTDRPFPGVNQNTDIPCYSQQQQNAQCL